MNAIFYGLVALSVLFAALNGTPAEVGKGALDAAKGSVDLAIGLVGYMALFLGLMAVVEAAGGLDWMARLVRPIMTRLFPDVPEDHPAMGAMIMNVSANALGLGNAATPFGLKAMAELDKLNKDKGTATDAMVLFLAINTSGLALIPSGIIGLRALNGSADPAAISSTTPMATGCSTLVGIVAAKGLGGLPIFGGAGFGRALEDVVRTVAFLGAILVAVAGLCGLAWAGAIPLSGLIDPQWALPLSAAVVFGLGVAGVVVLPDSLGGMLRVVLFGGVLVGLVALVYSRGEAASAWIIPMLVFSMLTVGFARRVPVYEVFVKGAREGFNLAVMIIPYLVAILSSVAMLRASGGLAKLVGLISPVTEPLGLPGEALPLALLRPLSGTGAFGITADLIQTHGADSYIGNLVATMNGSTETTFYVLAVYFGSVAVSRTRHAVPAGLAADVTGVIASVIAVKLLLG